MGTKQENEQALKLCLRVVSQFDAHPKVSLKTILSGVHQDLERQVRAKSAGEDL